MSTLSNQRGDTLVEVIFSLIILTAILVSALSLARVSRVNNQNSQLRTQTINLVQEQYEALKSYRQNVSWAQLGGPGGGIAAAVAGEPGCSLAVPLPGPCVFHMERDPVVGSPTYGQWVPCNGAWNPPIDADTGPGGWNTRSLCAGRPGGGYVGQPNITVQIQLFTADGCPQPDAMTFNVSGIWQQGGTSSQAGTNLETIIGNIKGDPPAC